MTVAPVRLIRQPAAPTQPRGSLSSRRPMTAIMGGRSCCRVTVWGGVMAVGSGVGRGEQGRRAGKGVRRGGSRR
jgi:hypothetical protein